MTDLEQALKHSKLSTELAAAVDAECRAGEAEAMSLLASLVSIDSFPEAVAGLDRIVEKTQELWLDLGFQTTVERTANGLPVLIADRVTGDQHPTALVLIHLDTVFPPGTVDERPFRVEQGKAFGPGVADMKGGAVVAWLAIRAAINASGGLGNLNLRIVCNTDEEAGSVESRQIIERQCPTVDLALVFEPGRPDGSIVDTRRGVRRYRITVEGRAAHTGVEPWAGANAIHEAAHKVLALVGLNDRDRSLSVTPAIIQGGARINIVPDRASIDVDVRIPDMETAGTTHDAIESIIECATVNGTSAHYVIFADRPPMTPNPLVPELVARVRDGASLLGLNLAVTATGGGSDGCFTSALGVPTLDALGPVGGGYHTADEFLDVESIVQRAAVSALFLASIG